MTAPRSLAWLAPLALVACARAPDPASPSAPGAAPAGQQQASPTSAPPPPPPAQAAPPAASPSPIAKAPAKPEAARPGAERGETTKKEAAGSGPRAAEPALETARLQLEEALALLAREDEHITKLSGSACGDACRALASMERAARTVCDLVAPDERARCDDAVARLKGARKRVRDACGACANGPTTDPDAPLR